MTKRQLIDEIISINQTAEPSFLAQFGDGDLDEYLQHLRLAQTPRLSGNPHRYDHYSRTADPSAATQAATAVVEADPQTDDDQTVDRPTSDKAYFRLEYDLEIETDEVAPASPAADSARPGRFRSPATDQPQPIAAGSSHNQNNPDTAKPCLF